MSESVSLAAPLPASASNRVVLNDQVVVRVSGATADAFLHGQFSQDLGEVTAARAPRAAACTHKGRAYCLTRLVRQGEDVLFALPASLADEVIAQLDKYRMLYRGTTMAIDPQMHIVGLLGTAAAAVIAGEQVAELTTADAALAIGPHTLIRTQDTAEGLSRYELWVDSESDDELAQALATIAEASPADWLASEIAAGVAHLTPATKEAYVPQLLNWQHLGGIHFNKGCYTGQEVVARMHFLGQLKRSLYRLALVGTDTLPTPGQALTANERKAGEIVTAVRYEDGTVEALAVVRHDAPADALRLSDSSARVEIRPLPYEVTERSEAHRDTDT
ncbi:YgfZ/GcvT domain-containing protein [Marinobacter sp. X15-166B]|uniref:CAF17-like 4Fe-4S cluster assembly/insertion protein YgfZ n=1 Tax=Marinobacter sp. X15-166B TaxID=1897620 RepID=UPI00085CD87B|nr:folate-binding protein YgfZ [Marinobacter sp. X15-166B]OEY66897.1 hypothetical protein BG841_10805 [Marinobacter sp. X15-166B]